MRNMPIEKNIKKVSFPLRHYLTEELQLIYALMAKIFDTATSSLYAFSKLPLSQGLYSPKM